MEWLQNLTTQDYVTFGLGVALLIAFFILRSHAIVINTVKQVLKEEENKFNSEDGQKRIEDIVLKVQAKLPKFAKPFITKALIISIIECAINAFGKTFNVEDKFDIKGNE